MNIRDYKLFIYEDLDDNEEKNIDEFLKSDYIEQISDKNNWIQISDQILEKIDNEFKVGDPEFLMKILILSKSHKIDIINNDKKIINFFDDLKKQIRKNNKNLKIIITIDYNSGNVFIIKYNKNKNDK